MAKLAKLAGVSVRTLHHYDNIGILKPADRTGKGYRYYGREELLRLQQILFYKELDIPLNQIADILDDPDFDVADALKTHKNALNERMHRLQTLLGTIDRTIADLKNKNMNYEKMYEGFSKEQIAEYEKEVTERWGADKLNESKQRLNAMTSDEIEALKQEGETINRELVALMDNKAPDSPEVQALVARHYAMVCKFHEFPPDAYRGLGDMYVADERFRINYDKHHEGLAVFLRDAIHVYCDKNQ